MSYEMLSIIVRIGAISFASSFKIVPVIPSGPAALFLYAIVYDIDVICSFTWFSHHNLFFSEFLFTDLRVV